MTNYLRPSGLYDWERILKELRRDPDQWKLMLRNAPYSLVRSIGGAGAMHEQRPEAVMYPGGRVQAMARNIYVSTSGHKRTDIYLRWHPIPGYNVLIASQRRKPVTYTKRDLFMSAEKKEAVKDYVWENRLQSMNALLNELLAEYAAGTPQPSTRPPKHDAAIRLHVDPEQWNKGMKRAKIEGVSLTSALMGMLDERMAPKRTPRKSRAKGAAK